MGISFTSACGGYCGECKTVEANGKPICMQVAIMERREISAEDWVEKFSARFREVIERLGTPNREIVEAEMFR